MPKLRKVLALPGLLLVLVLSACSLAEDVTPPPGFVPTQASSTSQPVNLNLPSTPPDSSRGAVIYAQKCAPCHGISGRGDGPDAAGLPVAPPAIGLADLGRSAKPADWFNKINDGQISQGMPGFSGSLDSVQIWNVVSYALSLSTTQTQIQTGQILYQQDCQTCHGPKGGSNGPKAADLISKPAIMSDPTYQAQHSLQDFYQVVSQGMGSDMPAFKNLDDGQRWAVLVYVRSLAFKPTTRPVAAAASVTATLPSDVAQVNGGTTTAAPPPTQTAGPASTQPVTGTTPSASPAAPGSNSTTPAVVSGQASILGKVVNSSNGRLPDGLKAALQITDGTKQTDIASSDVQPDGSYTFPNVDIINGQTYLISVQYNQQTFNSDLIHSSDLPPGGQVSTVVNIYDSSSNASVITADRLHVILDFSNPGVMQVVELFILSNPTDKVIVSSKPGEPILKFSLPLGASSLQLQDGDLGGRFVQTPNGFGDTQSVLPGSASHQVLFAFELPYQSGSILNLPMTLPVQNAIVMVPAGRVKLDSKQLKDTGTSSTQGMNLELYSSTNLSSGSILSMTISNAGGSGFLDGGSTSLIVAVIIFLLAVLAGLAFILRLRNNRAVPEMAVPARTSFGSRSDDTSASLMDGIIALDDMYQDGELPEEAYLKRRKELKDRLRALSGSEKKP